MLIKTVGIDLGKSVCHLVGQDARGRVVLRRRLSRPGLVRLMANLDPCLVGMEGCCGAHHLARQLGAQGHTVRLMSAAYVRPYVKSQKNDTADAEACAEAVQRPGMRFVPVKTPEQLDLQAVHRVRTRLVTARTRLVNQIRAFLLERGLTVRQGLAALRRALPVILDDAENGLGPAIRALLRELACELRALEERIAAVTSELDRVAKDDPACQRLTTIPGLGPITATALVAAIGDGRAFKKPRDLAAWLGLVPRQHTTGGRPRLLGISKHGNGYLRRLLVEGARALQRVAQRRQDRFTPWLARLAVRAHPNIVAVALAARLARIAHAVLTRAEPYRGATRAAA
jgi:transposase